MTSLHVLSDNPDLIHACARNAAHFKCGYVLVLCDQITNFSIRYYCFSIRALILQVANNAPCTKQSCYDHISSKNICKKGPVK